jgi:hypothetical protein
MTRLLRAGRGLAGLRGLWVALGLAAAVLAPLALTGEKKPAAAEGWRFVAADVFVDSGREQMVAYQVEVSYDRARVKVLGLEGGEPRGFKGAPHYDPAGMTGGRIVIAAFTTDDAGAPRGRSRIARLHLHVRGESFPKLGLRPVTAARPGGKKITVSFEAKEAGARKEKQE